MEAGSYDVQFRDNQDPLRYAAEWYDDQYFEEDASGLVLDPNSSTLVTGIDAQVAEPASISGTVSDAGGSGLAGICVNAALGQPVRNVSGTQTLGDGSYALDDLPPGDIYLYFHDCDGQVDYVAEWYDDQPNSDTATPVTQGPGGSTSGIDATLSEGDTISGTVTDGGGNPLADVNVVFEGEDHSWAASSTGPDGQYTSPALAPGDYRVRFEPNSTYAVEYWNDQPSWASANIVQVDGSGPVGGIDAQLAAEARITGTVTDPDGSPVQGACVGAVMGDGQDTQHVEGTQTDGSGNYVLDQLPAGTYRVYFDDCGNTGPFLEQFFDGSPYFDDATTITLAAGQTRANVDAEFVRAAQIAGTVTDEGGQPLEGICVQATTDSFVGGMDRTRNDGTYEIDMVNGGAYKVQFSDCGDEEGAPGQSAGGGTYLAKFYGGGIDPSTATPVTVAAESRVDGIDAVLSLAGGTGTVSGRVTNTRDEGLQACIALYMPTEAVRFMPTEADGSFTFEDVPTGTWTVGFLGCGGEDVTPIVPDAGGTGVGFAAAWLGGAPLAVGNDAPDPVAQGGDFITVLPGGEYTADMCFGCGSVEVDPPEVGDDYIIVTFNSTGLFEGDAQQQAASSGLTYNVRCTSDAGTPTSASAAAPGTPGPFKVKVSGFTPGAPYVCAARVLSGEVEVANARTFEVTVGQAAPDGPAAPSDPADPGTGADGSDPAAPGTATPASYGGQGSPLQRPASLAFTGGGIAVAVGLALLMITAGAAVVVATMRASGAQLRRRATS
ncbi:MAG: carboxypeptidase regulatory-like domain-containing protein [Microthrixaceae bacterium]